MKTLLLLMICVTAAFGGEVPAEMTGQWLMREGSGSSYVSPSTGSYSAPNANAYQYKIFADGRFQHAALLSSSLYNCTMQFFGYETGIVEVQGNRVTFSEQTSKVKSVDNCRPQWNYEKPTPLNRKSSYWRVDRDQYGQRLVLSNEKGQELVFYRQ